MSGQWGRIATFVRFDPTFEILPGTKRAQTEIDLEDFEVGEIKVSGE